MWSDLSHPVARRTVTWLLLAALSGACLVALRAEIVIRQKVGEANTPAAQGIAVPTPEDQSQVEHEDVVEFLNGDRLRGTFLSVDGRAGARWQHPMMRQVMSIEPGSLARIALDRPRATNAYAKQTCGVRLSNADELVGELTSIDAENLHLDTWYAGPLTIPRRLVESISPGARAMAPIYEGPTGLEGWTVRGGRANDAWQFADGAFVNDANGSIGRDFKLPDPLNIEFDLDFRGYLQFTVSFLSDKLERYGGNAYMLQFSYTSVYLQRMRNNGGSSSLQPQAQIAELATKTKAHISLRCSKSQRMIAMLMDGALIKQWTDREDFPEGGGIVFAQQGQGAVRIKNLRITQWDGKFEDIGATAVADKEDFVLLANNDKVKGKLKAVEKGKLSLQTDFATLDVPLERVARIDFAKDQIAKTESMTNQVRAFFATSGSITFVLERWDDRQVVANSPSFGRTRFQPAAFSSVEFNLGQPRHEPQADGLGEPDPGVIIFE